MKGSMAARTESDIQNIYAIFKKVRRKERRDFLQSLVLEKYMDLLSSNNTGAEPSALLDSALQYVAEQYINPFVLEGEEMSRKEIDAQFRRVVSQQVGIREAELLANFPAMPEDKAKLLAKEKFLKDVLSFIPPPPPIDPREVEKEYLPEIQR